MPYAAALHLAITCTPSLFPLRTLRLCGEFFFIQHCAFAVNS
jgi:hypothetical protein